MKVSTGWSVRFGGTPYQLGEGRWAIGRGPSCPLRSEDYCLSREHAVLIVERESLRISDLNSRHGSYRGSQRLEGEVSLSPGDVVMLGGTPLQILGRGARDEAPELPATAPGEPIAPSEEGGNTGQYEVEGALVASLSEFIQERDFHAARVVLERVFDVFRTREAMPMGADPALMRSACAEAILLADQTSSMGWLDETLNLHRVRPRVMSATNVQQLTRVLMSRSWPPPPALRGYVGDLIARAARLDSYERTVLEGLQTLSQRTGT